MSAVCTFAIADLLPHTGEMILLQRYEHVTDHSCSCYSQLASDNLFAQQDGQTPSYIGLELMAQAVALIGGWRARQQGRVPVNGFLLGTRHYAAQRTHFSPHDALHITAQELYCDEHGMAVYNCAITIDNQLMVAAKLNVFQPQQHNENKQD